MEDKEVKSAVNPQETDNNGRPDMDINADADIPGTSKLSNPASATSSELEALQQEIAGWKDKYIRQAAEFDNFRKRTARERVELFQTAGKEVIGALLEVLDDCDRAQKQLESGDGLAKEKEGIVLIFNKLRNILQAKGLKPMETIHEDFNPDLHEAISQVAVTDEALKGKVIDEVVKGYYLNDKILRFAKVVVGK